MTKPTDPAANLAALIRCPSVTPQEGCALTVLQQMLAPYRASGDGGQYLHWAGNGRTLAWSLGPTLYSTDAATVIRAGDDSDYTAPKTGVSLAMTVPSAKPEGLVALTGAKIITMADDNGGVIEDGVILIEDNKIRAVGPRGSVDIPAAAQQVDVTGKTIIPGLIDAHWHGAMGSELIIPKQNWFHAAALGYGLGSVFSAVLRRGFGLTPSPRARAVAWRLLIA